MRPHGLQPIRLLRPWDSPGKNTGVACHFLLQCMKVESESEVTQSCLTLSNPMDYSLPGSSIHGNFQATVLEWGAIAFSKFWLLIINRTLYISDGSSGKESVCFAGDTGDAGWIPGSRRSPGGGMATHSRILAWKIPGTEEPDGLQSVGSLGSDTTEGMSRHAHISKSELYKIICKNRNCYHRHKTE